MQLCRPSQTMQLKFPLSQESRQKKQQTLCTSSSCFYLEWSQIRIFINNNDNHLDRIKKEYYRKERLNSCYRITLNSFTDTKAGTILYWVYNNLFSIHFKRSRLRISSTDSYVKTMLDITINSTTTKYFAQWGFISGHSYMARILTTSENNHNLVEYLWEKNI